MVIFHYNFALNDVDNVDETVVNTIQKPSKIVSRKREVEQVGEITSTERGTLITFCTTINAIKTLLKRTYKTVFYDKFSY